LAYVIERSDYRVQNQVFGSAYDIRGRGAIMVREVGSAQEFGENDYSWRGALP